MESGPLLFSTFEYIIFCICHQLSIFLSLSLGELADDVEHINTK